MTKKFFSQQQQKINAKFVSSLLEIVQKWTIAQDVVPARVNTCWMDLHVIIAKSRIIKMIKRNCKKKMNQRLDLVLNHIQEDQENLKHRITILERLVGYLVAR